MIRGQKRTIKSPDNLDVRASIHNRFDIEVLDANTGTVKQTAQALNVICGGLWDRLLTPATYFNYIFYGGGTGIPSSSDTSLFSHIGYAAVENVTYGVDYSTGVYYRKGSVQLSAATAAGKTISEVGIGHGTSPSNLCTHAMLKDMNGDSISIEKTDTDVVNIYATVYVHFERLGYDNNTIFLLQQENYGASSWAGSDLLSWISGAYHSKPTLAFWTACDTVAFTNASYSGALVPRRSYAGVPVTYSGNKTARKATFTLARLEANAGNFDQGLKMVCVGSPNYDGMTMSRFVPAFLVYSGGVSHPYSLVEREAVGTGDGIARDFALDFAFAHDAHVYIDGVETTDFTLDYAPNTVEWLDHMRGIQAISGDNALIPQPKNSTNIKGRVLRFYNPAWRVGIGSVTIQYGNETALSFSVSDDNEVWETFSVTGISQESSTYTFDIPEAYQRKKFWRVTGKYTGGSYNLYAVTPPSTFAGKCLHLGTPPAEGAVITVDYKCDCFAKDANHVLDMSVTIQFGEYTET